MTSTDFRIETWPLERFRPYERNPRRNDAAVPKMVASIQEFGFKIPMLARSDGEVIDGHLRLKAAHELHLASVPVILCNDWTEAQVKAFRLMVNRSVTWAEWNDELLGVELDDLSELGFDLTLTGFDEDEITRLMQSGEVKPGAFAEYDENIPTEHQCPKCGFKWSGGDGASE